MNDAVHEAWIAGEKASLTLARALWRELGEAGGSNGLSALRHIADCDPAAVYDAVRYLRSKQRRKATR
jgi:hypothetical protein